MKGVGGGAVVGSVVGSVASAACSVCVSHCGVHAPGMALGCFYEVLIRVPARSSSRIQVRYMHYML